jgi:putative sterol carrier protein
MGMRLTSRWGERQESEVIGKLKQSTFDDIVNGRLTFQRAFMSGEMTAKGNFKTLRMLDEIFLFE